MVQILAEMTHVDFVFFLFLVFGVLAMLVLFFWFGRITYVQRESPSPYTGSPLRRTSELTWSSRAKIENYLTQLSQFDNQPFDLNKAAFCRDTGRIFPNCTTWTGGINCDWNFLQKRYPGAYISWGSLTKEQKDEIQKLHGTLEGFQTKESSSKPLPRMIEEEYAFAKPGPLYVDFATKTVLGWKSVPETDFEVLVVQHPLIVTQLNFNPDKKD